MKQNNFSWFCVVVCVVLWSLYEIYPPVSNDLVQAFASRAQNQDAAFKSILTQAAENQKAGAGSEFSALLSAVGTNDLPKYFPQFQATNQIKPNLYILNRIQREAQGKIKLGLDLQGGTSFLVQMDTNVLTTVGTNTTQTQADITSAALAQAIEVLRKRVDAFGVAEPVIQPVGADEILIQLPGLSQADKDAAAANIQRSAFLEFRMVADNSAQLINERTGEILAPIPPGYEVLKHIEQLPGGGVSIEAYVVKKAPKSGSAPDYLAGDVIKRASLGYDSLGNLQIDFELTSEAAPKFGELTRNYINHRMAIILDGDLYSAPNIQSPIETGNGQITGHYTRDEAQGLVSVLQNPLRAPVHIISSKDVGPTLGKDNIHNGIKASVYGVIFVSVFMLLYYRLAGLAANVALITNVVILLGVMCAAGTTFTLPGIAGGVLTVGMAVDANVLIYERIREELAKGKSLRGAIDAGYARAFGTIFDSHVTTLISSLILFWQGTGEIKGFGATLSIGVAASLFTALVVTRLIFNFLVERNLIKSLSMMHIITASKVNFMAVAKPLFIVTWLFVVLSLGFGVMQGKKLFGVDFLGGDSTTYSFAQRIGEADVRAELVAIGENDSQVQYQKDIATGVQTLDVTTPSGTSQKVTTALEQKFPQAQFTVSSSYSVGASVGADVRNSAIVASLCALFGILVYVAFRYEFSFAVAAVIAVLHDVLLTIGAFCIANYVSGRQFNATVVAAVLTIIGFSINDKIVIFDRIREDLKLGARGSFKEIINQALNQTLSRTIITSGTVFLATLSLFIFGGGVINDFAFTFLVGIITGTYSSIYIASVIVLWWHKGERPNIGGPANTAGQSAAPAKV